MKCRRLLTLSLTHTLRLSLSLSLSLSHTHTHSGSRSRSIDKQLVPVAGAEVKRGLVLFNGCLPEDGINPGAHHFGHTGQYVGSHGDLGILWMMGFER